MISFPDIETAAVGDIPALLVQLAGLQTALAARLMAAPAPATTADADDEWLTVLEAAKFLRCSPKTLYRRAKQMSSCCRRNGRTLLFSKAGLSKWLSRQKA